MEDLRPARGDVVRVAVPTLRREISPLGDLRSLAALFSLLRRWRPDIVHTHMAKAGFVGRLAAWLAGVPVIVHSYHGTVLSGYFDPMRSAAFSFLERSVGSLTTAVVVPSARLRNELAARRITSPARMVEIPVGIDLEPFRGARAGTLRAELGLGPDDPLVGVVARLVPIKGVDVFLDAAALVAANRADVTFVVAGDGELHASLVARAERLGIGARVCWLGWRADVASVYADLDIVVMSSWNEGVPVSLIEALATGRPVVATSVGGVPDVLADGENGVLVPPGDAAAIAAWVTSLLDDRARAATLGQRARGTAEPYHINVYVERVERLYTDLIARRARR